MLLFLPLTSPNTPFSPNFFPFIYLLLIKSLQPNLSYTDIHGFVAIYWSMVDLPGVTILRTLTPPEDISC